MILYLIRHAIAEDRSAEGSDEDRALTPRGKARMLRASEGLRKLKVQPELILTSPLRRARETAEILAKALSDAPVEPMAELAAGIDPGQAARALRAHARAKELALVGHQPGLGLLASLLLTGSATSLEIDLRKGGVVCIEAELSEGEAKSSLLWLATPKLLRSH
jgi:phosphohistidine phosphatase